MALTYLKLVNRKDSFPLSTADAGRVMVLFITYGILVIIAACYYYVASLKL
jgi:hypothetical protein